MFSIYLSKSLLILKSWLLYYLMFLGWGLTFGGSDLCSQWPVSLCVWHCARVPGQSVPLSAVADSIPGAAAAIPLSFQSLHSLQRCCNHAHFSCEEGGKILCPPRVQGETGKPPCLLLCWLVGEHSYALYRLYLQAVPRRSWLSTWSSVGSATGFRGCSQIVLTTNTSFQRGRAALAPACLRVSTVSVLLLFLAISTSFLVDSAVLLDDLFYFVQQEVVSISVKVFFFFLSFLVTPKSRTRKHSL